MHPNRFYAYRIAYRIFRLGMATRRSARVGPQGSREIPSPEALAVRY